MSISPIFFSEELYQKYNHEKNRVAEDLILMKIYQWDNENLSRREALEGLATDISSIINTSNLDNIKDKKIVIEESKDNKLYGIPELCELLNVNRSTIMSLINNGRIDGFKVGSRWKITQKSVMSFMSEQCKKGVRRRTYGR